VWRCCPHTLVYIVRKPARLLILDSFAFNFPSRNAPHSAGLLMPYVLYNPSRMLCTLRVPVSHAPRGAVPCNRQIGIELSHTHGPSFYTVFYSAATRATWYVLYITAHRDAALCLLRSMKRQEHVYGSM